MFSPNLPASVQAECGPLTWTASARCRLFDGGEDGHEGVVDDVLGRAGEVQRDVTSPDDAADSRAPRLRKVLSIGRCRR